MQSVTRDPLWKTDWQFVLNTKLAYVEMNEDQPNGKSKNYLFSLLYPWSQTPLLIHLSRDLEAGGKASQWGKKEGCRFTLIGKY